MLLIIDNYDSFTYNLVQYFQCLHQNIVVVKNDQISINEIKALAPHHLVISPGPKGPEDAGISLETIRQFYQSIPILGICLGHQCLGQAFGAKIIQASEIVHGKTSTINHHSEGLFKNVPHPFQATRYHSLIIDPDTLPDCFTIDAWTDQTIMAISHRKFPLYGVQFHPESILTEYGYQLLENFLQVDNLC